MDTQQTPSKVQANLANPTNPAVAVNAANPPSQQSTINACQCNTVSSGTVQPVVSSEFVQVAAAPTPNVVTIPVPIVNHEDTFTYVTVKGSLHDRTCAAFGLNETEIQALAKRFENGLKAVVNGVMVSVPPMDMVNTLAQLGYKVVCSSGEAEICFIMQREI